MAVKGSKTTDIKTHDINTHKFIIKHPPSSLPRERDRDRETDRPRELLESGWRQMEVLGIRDREKASLDLKEDKV